MSYLHSPQKFLLSSSVKKEFRQSISYYFEAYLSLHIWIRIFLTDSLNSVYKCVLGSAFICNKEVTRERERERERNLNFPFWMINDSKASKCWSKKGNTKKQTSSIIFWDENTNKSSPLDRLEAERFMNVLGKGQDPPFSPFSKTVILNFRNILQLKICRQLISVLTIVKSRHCVIKDSLYSDFVSYRS